MPESNYTGNIIVILANLPDFLRTPILKKRMMEFFSLSEYDKIEMVNNALQAGPSIPFTNFAKLFKTWLEVLTTVSEDHRIVMFSCYINEITKSPQKLINFNLDGILEIFISLNQTQKEILSNSVKNIISSLAEIRKKRLLLILPENAKRQLGI